MLDTGIPCLVIVTTLLAVIGVYLYQKKKKEYTPGTWKEVGTVEKLSIYPLKSGRRVELVQAECTNLGLRQTEENEKMFKLRDRFLIVFTEQEHEFRTARNHPKLMLITISKHEDHLKLDAPTMSTLHLKIPEVNVSEKISVKFHYGEIVHTTDCGNKAASWLSELILEKESGLRLGYNDGSYERTLMVPKALTDYYKHLSNSSIGLYSDLASVLLVNQKSVDDLNKRLENSSVTSNNFRPNIVIDGLNMEPYAEDEWEWIKIGEVLFRNIKDCTRCIMITMNPDTGIRSLDREPLKTLKEYRISKGPEKNSIMGIYLEVKNSGSISVGDKVLVSLK